jgi:hypothetical protein
LRSGHGGDRGVRIVVVDHLIMSIQVKKLTAVKKIVLEKETR